jgi:hypothetical protein
VVTPKHTTKNSRKFAHVAAPAQKRVGSPKVSRKKKKAKSRKKAVVTLGRIIVTATPCGRCDHLVTTLVARRWVVRYNGKVLGHREQCRECLRYASTVAYTAVPDTFEHRIDAQEHADRVKHRRRPPVGKVLLSHDGTPRPAGTAPAPKSAAVPQRLAFEEVEAPLCLM